MRTIVRSALTLIELVAATLIMTIVVMGVAAIDVGFRNMSESTTRKSIVASRCLAIPQHMAKYLGEAVSSGLALSTITTNGTSVYFLRDIHLTPDNQMDDVYVSYVFDNVGHQVAFCSDTDIGIGCNGETQELGGGSIQDFRMTLTKNTDPANLGLSLTVLITGRYIPGQAIDPVDNPEVQIETTLSLPGATSDSIF